MFVVWLKLLMVYSNKMQTKFDIKATSKYISKKDEENTRNTELSAGHLF